MKNKENILVVKKTVTKVERRESNKGQNYNKQEEFLVNMVKDW